MNLLPTSSGIRNKSIHEELVDLLGNPIAESNALFIPTRSTPSLEVLVWHGKRSVEKPRPPCANWVGSPLVCWSSPRWPASTKKLGSLRWRTRMLYWFEVAIPCTSATGSTSPD
jgi:hypothetical protein